MSDLNDPRVLFAAERTLLAWNRTSLTLMAFGFVIERFGLFVHMLSPDKVAPLQRSFSFWIGLAFILLGAFAAVAAVVQYRTVLHTLRPIEFPAGYRINFGVFINLAVAFLGVLLTVYLFIQASHF
ncbi:MAG: YidH family protein, partial [Thiobacillus sp.]